MADTNMTLSEKLVLSTLILFNYYKMEPPSDVSVKALKTLYGMSGNEIDCAMQRLYELGYIKFQKHLYNNGGYGYWYVLLQSLEEDFPDSTRKWTGFA